MKALSIGRDDQCDIIIRDNTNVISRRHAVLNIEGNGKMTITDLSSNGTYINGIRIAENTPVPVNRKDVVSFAHVYDLDWKLVPDSRGKIMKIMYLIIGIIVCVGITWGVLKIFDNDKDKNQPIPPTEIVSDSTSVQQPVEPKPEQKVDTLQTKPESDSTTKQQPEPPKKQKSPKKEKEEKEKTPPDSVQQENNNAAPIL